MNYQLLFTFLIILYPILVEGNTNKPLEPSQLNTTQKQKAKELSVSESTPAKKKNTKRKKQESKILIVKTALKYFVLNYGKNRVDIKGHQMDLSLDRKKCNAHIIDRFNKETAQLIRDALKNKEIKSTIKKKEIDIVEIQIEGKSYFIKFSSQIGQTLLYYPKEILRMKWEEKFNCEAKKKAQKKIKPLKKKEI